MQELPLRIPALTIRQGDAPTEQTGMKMKERNIRIITDDEFLAKAFWLRAHLAVIAS